VITQDTSKLGVYIYRSDNPLIANIGKIIARELNIDVPRIEGSLVTKAQASHGSVWRREAFDGNKQCNIVLLESFTGGEHECYLLYLNSGHIDRRKGLWPYKTAEVASNLVSCGFRYIGHYEFAKGFPGYWQAPETKEGNEDIPFVVENFDL
jgi:hypothetical protein